MVDFLKLPEQHLRSAYRAALRLELLRLVADSPRVAKRRRRQRRASIAVAVSLFGTAGGAVAYSAITAHRPVSDESRVRCYSIAEYHSGKAFPGATAGRNTTDGSPGSVTAAVATCAALWQIGVLQLGNPKPQHDQPRIQYVVPPLVECVLPSGQAAVFPGPADCLKLGLQIPTATPGG